MCRIHVARDHRQRRFCRLSSRLSKTAGLNRFDAVDRAKCLYGRRIEMGRLPDIAGAQIDVSWQQALCPCIERSSKRGDHDRHRHHEREAHDNGGKAQGRLSCRPLQMRNGDLPRHTFQSRCTREQPLQNGRHARHQSDDEQCNRDIARQWQAGNGREHQQRGTRNHERNDEHASRS